MPEPPLPLHKGGKSVAIVLQPRCAETRKAMLVDRTLPRQEFVDGQRISFASLLDAEKTAAYSGNHLSLAADDPSFRIPRGKICDCERRPIGSDHIAPARSHLLFGHDTRYTLLTTDLVITCLRLN